MRGARGGSVQWVQEPRDQGEIVRQYTKMDHRMERQDNPGLMIAGNVCVIVDELRYRGHWERGCAVSGTRPWPPH